MSNQTSELPSADQLRALASEIENPSKHGDAAGIEQIVDALHDINETLKNLYEKTLDTIIKTQVTLGTMQADIARILSDKQTNLSVVANRETGSTFTRGAKSYFFGDVC